MTEFWNKMPIPFLTFIAQTAIEPGTDSRRSTTPAGCGFHYVCYWLIQYCVFPFNTHMEDCIYCQMIANLLVTARAVAYRNFSARYNVHPEGDRRSKETKISLRMVTILAETFRRSNNIHLKHM
jgi:hypothetical protein